MMARPNGWKLILVLAACVSAIAAQAQVQFKTIFTFDGTDGVAPPYMFLTQATDGNFYGTTKSGGAYGYGTVFKITPSGTQTVVYNFCPNSTGNVCPDGGAPYAGVIQGSDGNFYGTTYLGGIYFNGTVFKLTPTGVLTTLYSFCPQGNPCLDGALPAGGLIQGSDGNFYGTTSEGGAQGFYATGGTVFQITPDGVFTSLYSFCSIANICPDGYNPFSSLIEGTDGNYYGMAQNGGTNDGSGTVFKITSSGDLTTIYNFCAQPNCTDGEFPRGPLVVGVDGNYYGTTENGGALMKGGQGTVFKITPTGDLTTLYTFCEHPDGKNGTHCPDGADPWVGLTLASNGYLAGTTDGAIFDGPTIFGISPTGTNFEQYTQAGNTPAGLLQGTNGIFYGMAGVVPGSIFSLSVGLAPFIKTTPTFGPTTTSVIILGTNLTGTTSVTFNGAAAKYTVVSASEITTSVPAGASSGRVKVKTPSGTLISNLPFTVTQ